MAIDDEHRTVSGDGVVSSGASSVTEVPLRSHGSFWTERSPDSPGVPPLSAGSMIMSAGTATPMRDDMWTSSDEKDGVEGAERDENEGIEEIEGNERRIKGRSLTRTETNMSIAETLPFSQEALFVMVICSGQLFTRKSSSYRLLSDLFGFPGHSLLVANVRI